MQYQEETTQSRETTNVQSPPSETDMSLVHEYYINNQEQHHVHTDGLSMVPRDAFGERMSPVNDEDELRRQEAHCSSASGVGMSTADSTVRAVASMSAAPVAAPAFTNIVHPPAYPAPVFPAGHFPQGFIGIGDGVRARSTGHPLLVQSLQLGCMGPALMPMALIPTQQAAVLPFDLRTSFLYTDQQQQYEPIYFNLPTDEHAP